MGGGIKFNPELFSNNVAPKFGESRYMPTQA